MDRYVGVHGHFYQPPREHAWLESIELQDSAYPYHDWNERITAECYAPNATLRILDAEGSIVAISNNYAGISFNIGPTLLAWLEANAPEAYQRILAADHESKEAFSGHGSAMTQVYNHMILPLANSRDRRTQVAWGIRDFEQCFGRLPEGMWLPETAVDLETLEVLAEQGTRFTVLAPHQAARVRRMGERAWQDVPGARVDPRRSYRVNLPSGRQIAVFFYDGGIANSVAFEGLLRTGDGLAHRLLAGFTEGDEAAQLVHIATDGEIYGHHHRDGDMALAYALDLIRQKGPAKLTNYAEFLERFPPTWEVQIEERTSWSCAYGVERWRADCGCHSGGSPGWNQAWCAPLQEAMDWLRDGIAPVFEEHGRQLFSDPWDVRNDYISVVLDRSDENVDHFLSRFAAHPLTDEERTRALKLMEIQRHAMLMYTSCGWFLDDLPGIETVQVIQYASRVVQLAQELFGDTFEEQFLERLTQAKSNRSESGDGKQVFEQQVRTAMVDLVKVGAHYAVSSVFEVYGEVSDIHSYRVERERYEWEESGLAQLAVEWARFTSRLTRESVVLSFGVLHSGDHNVSAGVRGTDGDGEFEAMVAEAKALFQHADLPEVLRTLDRYFQGSLYSLKTLFRDEQREVLRQVLHGTLAEAEQNYRQLYEHHAPLMRFMGDLGMPLANSFLAAAKVALNAQLRRVFEDDVPDPFRIKAYLDEVTAWG